MEGSTSKPEPTPPQPGGAPPRGTQAPGTMPPPGHDANPHDRIDGLRTWLGEVERTLKIRTWLSLAVGAAALAAAIVAIVLVQGTRQDSATDADVQNLREELTGVEQSASRAAEQDVQSLSSRLSKLEDEVDELRSDQSTTNDELTIVEDDIDDLRNQISDLDGGGSGGGGQ